MPKTPRKTATGDGPEPVKTGDRIAKVLARAGVASRRVAEGMIAEGRVAVNGVRIDSPALNIGPRDKITVDEMARRSASPSRSACGSTTSLWGW